MGVPETTLVAGPAYDVTLGRDDVAHLVAVLTADPITDLNDLPEKLMTHNTLGLLLIVERAQDHVAEGFPPPDASVRTTEPRELDLDDHESPVSMRWITERRTRNPLFYQTRRLFPRLSGLVESQRPHRIGHAAPCAPSPWAGLHIVLIIRHDGAVMVSPVVGGVRHCGPGSDDRVTLALESNPKDNLVEAE